MVHGNRSAFGLKEGVGGDGLRLFSGRYINITAINFKIQSVLTLESQ